MQKWEYKVVDGSMGDLKEMELDKLGSEGWELVLHDERGFFYFKRPKS